MFINYAHRGASAYMPENTLSAFYLGLIQHANGIETDVQKTKDGVLVLFHDETIERVTNIPGKISDYTYLELLKIKIKGETNFFDKIVTLEDFLIYFSDRDLTLAVELKADNLEEDVIALIKKYGVVSQIIITSFKFEYLKKIRSLGSNIRLGYLVKEINNETLKLLSEINAYEICPKANILDSFIVKKLKSLGYGVRAWGVSDEQIMREIYTMGVDGMTVNFPDKLNELINL